MNAWGFMVSIWLNMAAVKLQYSDRVTASLRSSFVQLLDNNRKSFRGLDIDNYIADQESGNAPVQTFANLRKMALEIAIQKVEAPVPHEKVVMGCKFAGGLSDTKLILKSALTRSVAFGGLVCVYSYCFLVGGDFFAVIFKG
jgi:hypothetical protein